MTIHITHSNGIYVLILGDDYQTVQKQSSDDFRAWGQVSDNVFACLNAISIFCIRGGLKNLFLFLIYPSTASMICHSLEPTPECFPRTLKPTDSSRFFI